MSQTARDGKNNHVLTPLAVFIMPFCLGIAIAEAKWAETYLPSAYMIGWVGIALLILCAAAQGTGRTFRWIRFLGALGAGLAFLSLGFIDMGLSRKNIDNINKNLTDLARHDEEHILTGQVIRAPVPSKDGTRLFVAVFRRNTPAKDLGAQGYINLSVDNVSYRDVSPGDWIRFKTSIRPVRNFKTPGAFDIETWWAARGIKVTGHVKSPLDIAIIGHSHSSAAMDRARYLIELTRKRLLMAIDDSFKEDDVKGFAAALLTGEKTWLPGEVKDAFSITGTSHLLAVSGLHMGLMALFTGWVVRFLLLRSQWIALRVPVRKIAIISALASVMIYAGLAGFSPSAMRATIMVLAVGAAYIFARPQTSINSIAIAAWCLLIYEPLDMFNVSFQLSFAAALFLILFSVNKDRAQSPPGHMRRGLSERTREFAFVTIAATIATLPLIAWYFQRISIISLPANIFMVPVTSAAVLPGLMLGGAAMFVSKGLAALAWKLTGYVMAPSLWLIETISRHDWAYIFTPRPLIWQIWVFYLALLSLAAARGRFKNRIRAGACALIMICLVPWHNIFRPDDVLRLHVLDVGQGLAQVIELPDGRLMVIDAGGLAKSDFDMGERVVAPFIRTLGYSKIDILAASHPEEDHIGGLAALTRQFSIGELWTNEDGKDSLAWAGLMAWRAKKRIRHKIFDKDQTFYAKDAYINIMTSGRCLDAKKPNSRCLVFMLGYKGHSILLPGDIDKKREACLAADGLKDVDVLIAPHHGSKTSNSEEFIAAARPSTAIISAGWRNRLGLPKPEVLERYKRAGSRILRTDLDGTITVEVRDSGVRIQTSGQDH